MHDAGACYQFVYLHAVTESQRPHQMDGGVLCCAPVSNQYESRHAYHR
ncbi:hypothetical protein VCR15J5_740007 [Vibrio crassostreae]|nr:hypothetical protein VCR15J5_740007 [Vibrio crassostreae]